MPGPVIDSKADGRPDMRHSPASSTPPTQIPAIAIDAMDSLTDALRDGDDRTPPIERTTNDTPVPTPSELADPTAYLRYQSRQQSRLYASFERHALIALADMQRDLQRARAEHLPPELIAEGEEKMQKLAETLERLRQREAEPVHP